MRRTTLASTALLGLLSLSVVTGGALPAAAVPPTPEPLPAEVAVEDPHAVGGDVAGPVAPSAATARGTTAAGHEGHDHDGELDAADQAAADAYERAQALAPAVVGLVPTVPFVTSPDPLARYREQNSCDPASKPGTAALRALVMARYNGKDGGIVRNCSIGGTSEHKEGRAWDWMLNSNDPVQAAVAQEYLAWLTGPDAQGVNGGNARRLGVMYVIWNRTTWQSWRATDVPGSGWKAYTGSNPHTDHIHTSLSWDGAMGRTSWWTGRAITQQDLGPCQVFVNEPVPVYTSPNYSCPAPRLRPATWLLRDAPASAGAPAAGVFEYGSGGNTVLACDWDGDGIDTPAVYQDGTWFIRNGPGSGAPQWTFSYGNAAMRPVCGDWDGDGRDSIGAYHAGNWYLRDSIGAGAPDRFFSYGYAAATPVVGDWNGDGTDTVGLYDKGTWLPRDSNTPGAPTASFVFGGATSRPVSGDWDGDGRDGIGLWDGANWFVRNTATPGAPSSVVAYGYAGVAPVVGVWGAASRGADGIGVVDSGR